MLVRGNLVIVSALPFSFLIMLVYWFSFSFSFCGAIPERASHEAVGTLPLMDLAMRASASNNLITCFYFPPGFDSNKNARHHLMIREGSFCSFPW